MLGQLIGEVFGTFILILLGDGVVANVGLAPRLGAAAYNWNTITIGWAFAVIVAVYVSAGVSGAHLNPAVTIALAVKRDFPWGKVLPYIASSDGWRFPRRSGCLPGATWMVWWLLACRMCGAPVRVLSSVTPSGVRPGCGRCFNRWLLAILNCFHHRSLRYCCPAVGHPRQWRFQEYRPDAQYGPIPGRRHRAGGWSYPWVAPVVMPSTLLVTLAHASSDLCLERKDLFAAWLLVDPDCCPIHRWRDWLSICMTGLSLPTCPRPSRLAEIAISAADD